MRPFLPISSTERTSRSALLLCNKTLIRNNMIDEILKFNQEFVANKDYEKYITTKYPDKKIAILSCMDTRLTELLPAALGIKNGDVKMIKNAGGIISHPFGSVIRSLLVAIYELGVTEVMVIAHSDCGACHMSSEQMISHMKARGIKQEELASALEVSRQTIGSLENGRYNPSILLAFKIARYFGLAIEDIFIYEEEGDT